MSLNNNVTAIKFVLTDYEKTLIYDNAGKERK